MGIRKSARTLVAVALAAVIGGLIVACGGSTNDSSSSVASSASSPGAAPAESAPVRLQESVYTVADVEAAGWKRSSQLDNSGLEGSTEIWYGFFDQRDIELWVYPTFDDALSLGAPVAQSIMDENRVVDPVNSIRGGTNVYAAYVVVGNMVMLCETGIGYCDALVERLG